MLISPIDPRRHLGPCWPVLGRVKGGRATPDRVRGCQTPSRFLALACSSPASPIPNGALRRFDFLHLLSWYLSALVYHLLSLVNHGDYTTRFLSVKQILGTVAVRRIRSSQAIGGQCRLTVSGVE